MITPRAEPMSIRITHRRSRIALVWLLSGLFALIAAAPAAADPWRAFQWPRFERTTADDGLPGSIITAVAQDADGFLWVGTFSGLARMDGQRVINFHSDDPVEGALPDQYVRTLLALGDGRLLVGTNIGGLAVLDTRTQRFSRVPLGTERSLTTKVFSLRLARDGQVLVMSDLGLDRFDPATGNTTPVSLASLPADHSRRIFDAIEDAAGRLWLGGNPGLFVRDGEGGAFRRVRPQGLPDNDLVWRLHRDRQDRLWIGAGSSGVFLIDADGKEHALPGVSGSGGLHHSRTIRAFAETGDGALWIATDGAGAIRCDDSQCAQPQSLMPDSADAHSLHGDIVRDLLVDRSGILWAATSGGLSRHMPQDGPLLVLGGSRGFAPILLDNAISALLVDDRGRIWLGLSRGGVAILDLDAGTLRHVELPHEFGGQRITAMLQTADRTIWIAELSVLGLDPDNLQATGEVAELTGRRIRSLTEDGDGILVGTYDGMFRLDRRTRVAAAMERDPDTPAGRALTQIFKSVRTDTRRWYGGLGGLVVQDGDAEPVLLDTTGAPRSSTNDLILSLAHDPRHQRLWIGTEGPLTWLDLRERGNYRFHKIDDSGVAVNSSLVVEPNGTVWTQERQRLVRIDGDTLQTRWLSQRDGLRRGSYFVGAAATGPNGEVLFGGEFGLLVVRPERIDQRVSWRAPLRIGGLEVNGQARPPMLDAGGGISLDSTDRNIAVDFALLDFRAPQETRYSYRLEGFENAWHSVPAGVPARAIYTNLPTGQYRLQLRAEIFGLDARVESVGHALSVAPHLHETLPARIAQALALVLVAVGLVFAGLRWSHRQRRMLDHLVAERTRELHEVNARLKALASTDALTGLHTRRHFMDAAEELLVNARRFGNPLSVLLLDLDHFKAINDQHGHLAGDVALTAVARAIAASCRAADCSGRYGGEEIILCLPSSDAAAARELAERLRTRIEALQVRYGESVLPVTASIGIATLTAEDADLDALIKRADRALYAAKDQGRNRVEVA